MRFLYSRIYFVSNWHLNDQLSLSQNIPVCFLLRDKSVRVKIIREQCRRGTPKTQSPRPQHRQSLGISFNRVAHPASSPCPPCLLTLPSLPPHPAGHFLLTLPSLRPHPALTPSSPCLLTLPSLPQDSPCPPSLLTLPVTSSSP